MILKRAIADAGQAIGTDSLFVYRVVRHAPWSITGARPLHAVQQAVFADLLAVFVGLANLFALLKDGHAVMVLGICADRNIGTAGFAGSLFCFSFRFDAVDHTLH